MAKLISGKIVSVKVRNEVKKETEELRENHGIVPGLAVILVGNDPASQVYVRNKQRACEEVGFHPYEYRMNENATQEQLLDLIGVLNKDNKVNGILVQLPLPEHIDEQAVIHAISPLKDVDVSSLWLYRIKVHIATELSILHAVDANINDNCPFFHHVRSDKLRLADGNYQNICTGC